MEPEEIGARHRRRREMLRHAKELQVALLDFVILLSNPNSTYVNDNEIRAYKEEELLAPLREQAKWLNYQK